MGYFPLGRIFGVPARVHVSALLGALFFSGLRFAPGAWLGFFLVILVHELGHALVVRRTGQRVIGVNIHGLGGECAWQGNPSPLERAMIAWGGVWAQLVLFALAMPLSLLLTPFVAGVPLLGSLFADLMLALTWNSLLLAALNLIPFGPLDGAEAWKLPKLLWARRNAAKRRPQPEVRFRATPATAPAAKPRAAASPASAPPPAVASMFEDIARQAREARKGSGRR